MTDNQSLRKMLIDDVERLIRGRGIDNFKLIKVTLDCDAAEGITKLIADIERNGKQETLPLLIK